MNKNMKGTFLVVFSGLCWGLSGVSGKSIFQSGNCYGTAYLAPVFILLFCLAAEKRKPQLTELIVLFLVILGVFLLASHGSIYTLLIPKEAMFFGIASAVFLSVYNLQPKKLLGRFGLLEVIGWGMLTGGLILAAFAHLWDIPGI